MTLVRKHKPPPIDAMSPMPPDELPERLRSWLDSVTSVGGLSASCAAGIEALSKLLERFSKRQVAELTGGNGHARSRKWSDPLQECCHLFVERCAELVECCNGTPPELLPRILNAAVALAETLGRTGPLLAAMDKELGVVESRTSELTSLYKALKHRLEELTVDVGKEEQLTSRCRELRNSLRLADQRAIHAEREAAVVRKQLANQHRGSRMYTRPSLTGTFSIPEELPPPSEGRGTPSSSSMASPPTVIQDFGDVPGVAENSQKSLGCSCSCSQQASVEQLSFSKSAGLPDVLDLGFSWGRILSPASPLTPSLVAAFEHLATLTRQALQTHGASLSLPAPSLQAEVLHAMSPAAGLEWVASSIRHWSEEELSSLDPSLGTSVKHAAVNLGHLAGLSDQELGTLRGSASSLSLADAR